MKHTDISPLGAAALAGTTFPIDREMTAELWALPNLTATPLMQCLTVILSWNFLANSSIFDDAYEPYL